MANLQPVSTNTTTSKLNPSNLKTIVPTQFNPNTANAISVKTFFDAQRYNTSPATVSNAFDANPIRTFDFIVGRLSGSTN